MCGRYTLHSPAEVLRRRFRVDLDGPDLQARYNICPSQDILTVAVQKEGERKAISMRWGFIPPWEPEPRTKLSTINAKLETVARSRLYRTAFRKRRCLILADGFFEWQPAPAGQSGGKTPYWIHRKDGAPFAFAGLYAAWRRKDSPEGLPLLSCTILTTAASPVVESIHARMPVILGPESEAAWIDTELQDPEAVAALLRCEAPATLEARMVSRRVNSPRSQGPGLIAEAPEAGFGPV